MITNTLHRRIAPLVLAAALAGPARADDFAAALKTFESWNQGAPVSQLAATRQAVFKGTADPTVKKAHESALLAFLATDADTQAKQRVLGWLGDIAGDTSVPVLAKLLDDKALGSAACGTLERIPGKAANDALLAALKSPRIDVIHSLGRRNDPANEKPLLEVLQSGSDPSTRKAALTALASMNSQALRKCKAPKQLATAHGLALLQLADRARSDGDLKDAAGIYRQVSGIAPTLKRECFLGLLATSPEDQDERLYRGLGDEILRPLAIRQIRSGAGSASLLAELVRKIARDPSAIPPSMIRSLAARTEAHAKLRPVLAKMLETPGPARLVAIDALAQAGTGNEAELLLALAAGGGQEDKSDRAAFATLSRMQDPAVNAVLQRATGKDDGALSATAIKLLGARGGPKAASQLWGIAREGESGSKSAAIAALATMLPPKEFPALLKFFLTSEGSPMEGATKAAVWQMLRRLPDQAEATRQVEVAAAKASPESAAALKAMLQRIKPNMKKTPKPQAKSPPVFPKNDDRAVLQPNGYREVLLHNAGAGSVTKAGKVALRCVAGSNYAFFSGGHPLSTVEFGSTVGYELTGLDPKGEYVLGLTWWDVDSTTRMQEVKFDGTLAMPATPPLAYHANKPTWSRFHLPVPATALKDGKLEISINRLDGPNAVVNQLWLLQREAKAPATKRVLIVTGDDYPGHRWRETGPEFAAMLREDPKLEVTISETPFILASPLLGHYDAVFLHFKNYAERLPTTKALWTNLDQFVRNGGGLVVAHFGCGALQEWDGFVKLGGRIWNPKLRGHDPYGEFLIRILNDSHPATQGMKEFTTRDELYTCLDGDTAIDVLAEATSKKDKKNYPMAFTVREAGKGRVFHCPLGHDKPALKHDGARQLYRQATAWAAGL